MPELAPLKTEPPLLDSLAKEVTTMRILFAGVVGLVFFGMTVSNSWSAKADSTTVRAIEVRVSNIEQTTKSGGIFDVRLQNIERSQQWQLDTMWQAAKRDGLVVVPPPQPEPMPVFTPTPMPDGSPR